MPHFRAVDSPSEDSIEWESLSHDIKEAVVLLKGLAVVRGTSVVAIAAINLSTIHTARMRGTPLVGNGWFSHSQAMNELQRQISKMDVEEQGLER